MFETVKNSDIGKSNKDSSGGEESSRVRKKVKVNPEADGKATVDY